MALKIRMQRGGSTHNPQYRLVVAESTSPRDGKFVEILGTYAPKAKKAEEQFKLNLERFDYWVKVGAKPSDTARTLANRYRRTQKAAAGAAAAAPAPAAEAAPAGV